MKQVIVRQYGLLPPIDWDNDAQEHLWLQNKLWNRLVEIERDHRVAYQEATSQDEAVHEAETEMESLKDRKATAMTQKKALRSKARSKKIDTTSLDSTIKDCQAKIKDLSVRLKELRKAAREKNKAAMDALEVIRKDAAKKGYQESGLWWGNYNAVLNSYNVARVKAMKDGAELKFHSFDGSGRFTCQIQGGMSVDDLFAGQKIVGVKPLPVDAYTNNSRGERRRLQRTELVFTIYTSDKARRTLTFPMVMHRPIPDSCLIKMAVISRKKVGTDFKWAVTFTCTKEAEPIVTDQSKTLACGINFGWKQIKNGSLRVATVLGSDGTTEHINLPADIPLKLKHVDNLKSDLDTGINEIHQRIKAFEFDPDAGNSEDWEYMTGAIQRIKKAPKIGPGKLAACVLCWRDKFPEYEPEFIKKIESWRKSDKRKRNEMDNLRDKITSRRLDFYRNEAKKIAEKYGMIGLHEFDLRKAALVKTDDDNNLHQIARRNRTIAAVSELREWIKKQADKTGSQIQEVKGPITVICHNCGHEVSKDDKTDFIWACDRCGQKWDQDINAAQNVLNTLMGVPANHKLEMKDAV